MAWILYLACEWILIQIMCTSIRAKCAFAWAYFLKMNGYNSQNNLWADLTNPFTAKGEFD